MRSSRFIFWVSLLHVGYAEQYKLSDQEIKATEYGWQSNHFRGSEAVAFVFFALFVMNLINHMLKRNKLKIPLTLFTIVFGMIWGAILHYVSKLNNVHALVTARPSMLLELYLPVMIFRAAYTLNYNLFFKAIKEILIISILVYLFSLTLVGFVVTALINSKGWSALVSVLFGTLCIPIYPVMITRCLQEIGNHTKYIRTLFEGEAVVTLSLCSVFYLFITCPDHPSDYYVRSMIDLVLGSLVIKPIIGGLIAMIAVLCLRFNQSAPNAILITVAFPMFAYSLVSNYNAAGCITSLVCGFVLGMDRKWLPPRVEQLILLFFDLVVFCLTTITFAEAGVCCVIDVYPTMKYTDPIWVIVTYIMVQVCRLISFLVFLPFLSRIGQGLSFQTMLIMVWCGSKNPLVLSMTLALVDSPFVIKDETYKFFLMHITGLFLLQAMFNGLSAEFILRLMGITKISPNKQMNMNNCMKLVLERRERAILLLKMDKRLTDVNWVTVNAATEIRHPYMINLTATRDMEIHLKNKFTFCPDCKKNIFDAPTGKEYREMIKEAHLRVLRAKKIAYTKQHECGLLSRKALKVLCYSADTAMNSEKWNAGTEDIRKYFQNRSLQKRFVELKVHTVQQSSDQRLRIGYFRKTSDWLAKSLLFFCYMYFMALIHSVIHIVEYVEDKNMPLQKATFPVNIFCFLMYLVEFVVDIASLSKKSIGKGLFKYYTSFWTVVKFIILIAVIQDIILHAVHIYKNGPSDYYNYIMYIYVKFVTLLRLLVVVKFIKPCYKGVIEFFSKKSYRMHAFAFEVGLGFVRGENEALELLPNMIDNAKVRDEMKTILQGNKLDIMKLMAVSKKGKPWVSPTVKTKQVIKTVLNKLLEAIHDLKLSGWIDEVECFKLNAAVEERFKKVNAMAYVPTVRPRNIFKEIPWMGNEEEVTEYLYSNIVIVSYEPGDQLVSRGDILDGVYIVITGFLHQNYSPSEQDITDLENDGKLPVLDYPGFKNYKECFTDVIILGNTIGELSVLTGRPYSCDINTEAHTLVYIIQRKHLEAAFKMSKDPVDNLYNRMWKYMGIDVAVPVLINLPGYQSSDGMVLIKEALERSFMPNLSTYRTFSYYKKVEAAVLIEGQVLDQDTDYLYTAPCHIPKNSKKLFLMHANTSSTHREVIQTKLLIIPVKDADKYEIMVHEENVCDIDERDALGTIRSFMERTPKQDSKRKQKAFINYIQMTQDSNMNQKHRSSIFFAAHSASKQEGIIRASRKS